MDYIKFNIQFFFNILMKEKEKFIESPKKFNVTIKINNYKFFPSEEIQGFILVQNSKNIDYCNYLDSPEFCFTLTQKVANLYIFNSIKILKIDEQIHNYNDFKGLDTSNGLKIPFKYKIPDVDTPEFSPSFRYFSPKVKSIISHTLTVEIPFLSNKTNINIFIKKPPIKEKEEKKKIIKEELDKAVFGDELIKKLFTNMGRLSYYIKTKKSISYKEKLPIEINIDKSQLGNIKVESVILKIQKSISIFDGNDFKNGEFIENVFDAKKIIFKKNTIATIIESIYLPKTEFIPISIEDIHCPKLTGKDYNFTPPVNNRMIICNYYLIVEFIFSNNLMKDKTVKIPFDLFDDEYNIVGNNKNNGEGNEIINIINDEIGSINDNYDDDNPNNDLFREFEKGRISRMNNNEKDIKNNKEFNGFIVFDDNDFMKSFNSNITKYVK